MEVLPPIKHNALNLDREETPQRAWWRPSAVVWIIGIISILAISLFIGKQAAALPVRIGPHQKFPNLPSAGQNNVWYQHNDSQTVYVLVHGLFSDSRNCWLAIDPTTADNDQYWPALITNDSRLNHPSVFLGGYATSIESGAYDIRQAAGEIRDALKREQVLDKQRIVFIAHSLGGIVTRFLLTHNQELFAGKQVGLVLYASPSNGAKWADTLEWLSEQYGNALAKQLRPKDPILTELDKDFRDLLYAPNSHPQRLRLVGAEGIENYFILHRKFLPDKSTLVDEESGSRYFGAPRYLRGTDHYSIVKPTSLSHPAHELLIAFNDKFNRELPPGQPTKYRLSQEHSAPVVQQETHGNSSPAVHSNGNVTISIDQPIPKQHVK